MGDKNKKGAQTKPGKGQCSTIPRSKTRAETARRQDEGPGHMAHRQQGGYLPGLDEAGDPPETPRGRDREKPRRVQGEDGASPRHCAQAYPVSSSSLLQQLPGDSVLDSDRYGLV